jgi:hypothetical protein
VAADRTAPLPAHSRTVAVATWGAHPDQSRNRRQPNDRAKATVRFDPHTFTAVLTNLILGTLAGHGPLSSTELAMRVFPVLKHGWATRDGRPVTEHDITVSIAHQIPLLEGLDLIDTSTPAWTAGPSTRSLLPGATMLAELPTRQPDESAKGSVEQIAVRLRNVGRVAAAAADALLNNEIGQKLWTG